ncbi:MAG TPA: hypothetical protein VK501_12900 [Baekduia sp.]|uniref:hypothetical protein n=1 Tax=Baekduia sp. TaxID=2600305 RepID=UPI002C795E2D|nr:hypothetical protein [Baekduia sp.]HMJ34804.1 hypothetical protein [Baekduia sp.]
MPHVVTGLPDEQLILTAPEGLRLVIMAERARKHGEDAGRLVVDAPREVQVLRGELDGRRPSSRHAQRGARWPCALRGTSQWT